jgi:hypothetical protein
MTCVNLVTFFTSHDFPEMVEEMYDKSESSIKRAIELRMSVGDKGDGDIMDIFKMIKEMGANRVPGL